MGKNIQNLKGFRDFIGKDKKVRDYVEHKLKESFELFGFQPLETPSLEYAELLMGKYGEEADKLVYNFTDRGGRKVALRYDLTVPTTRVISQYQNDLPKFYRRYQLQDVYRAEKPQKGRYRQFKQCDIDVFGTSSPVADAEIIACFIKAYEAIGFDSISLQINDRNQLIGSLENYASDEIDVFSIIQSIDKLDKLSKNDVISELVQKGLSQDSATQALEELASNKPSESLQEIMHLVELMGVKPGTLTYTPYLARGLDYYTGVIFEIKQEGYPSSLGSGGRYDNLVSSLSGHDVPAVGASVGLDRTVEAAIELGLIDLNQQDTYLVLPLGEKQTDYAIKVANQIRGQAKSVQIYPQPEDSASKQLKYADQLGVNFAVIVGEQESAAATFKLKDMSTGEEVEHSL